MRKVTRVAVALLLILSLSLTAFAAGSKTYATEVSAAKDASGNAVEVTTTAASVQLSQTDAESMIKADEGQVVSVAYTADVSVPEGTSFPVDITFSVSGLTSDMKVVVLHYNGSAWETVDSTVSNGSVTATFTSLSPVAVVVAADQTVGGTTSAPKTGESNMIVAAGAVVLVAGIGAYLATRKERA